MTYKVQQLIHQCNKLINIVHSTKLYNDHQSAAVDLARQYTDLQIAAVN
jgi:hypothetical protein